MTTNLTKLPNIGKTLAEKLVQIGINSELEMQEQGSENIFIKLKTVDPNACYNMLCAIEGAIQGIRWHSLDTETKNRLKYFCKQVK